MVRTVLYTKQARTASCTRASVCTAAAAAAAAAAV